jgi:hypothetical protein
MEASCAGRRSDGGDQVDRRTRYSKKELQGESTILPQTYQNRLFDCPTERASSIFHHFALLAKQIRVLRVV